MPHERRDSDDRRMIRRHKRRFGTIATASGARCGTPLSQLEMPTHQGFQPISNVDPAMKGILRLPEGAQSSWDLRLSTLSAGVNPHAPAKPAVHGAPTVRVYAGPQVADEQVARTD
jgi:hypothetical protein